MTTVTNRQTLYLIDNFYSPDWWDGWAKKNLRRKLREFSRNLNQQPEGDSQQLSD
jgi:hypothetical protein